MSRDPARAAAAQAWLKRAAQDLRACERLVGSDPPLVGASCFHAQPTAEKSLKALLTWQDVPFRKTHDLGELGRQVEVVETGHGEIAVQAERLTVFAWIFRYPGEPTEPPAEEGSSALSTARALHEAAAARLSADPK